MTTSRQYDTIVIGLGGMGSATLFQLTSRGHRVLGIERFGVPHDMGSSHGYTRIFRLAYYEHPSYVPLMLRARELWFELQDALGEQIVHVTGSIDAGPEDSFVFSRSLESCVEHGLRHEVLTSAELTRRFPAYRLPNETMALHQPEGGFLVPERCIEGYVNLARELGAEVHIGEQLISWETRNSDVKVRTDEGEYTATSLVLTAGAWTSKLVPPLADYAVPERQVLAWFEISSNDLYTPERFPVFNVLVEEGRYYGFPQYGVPGFKVGRYHHLEEKVDPDALNRESNDRDEGVLREFAEKYFPEGAGKTHEMKVCMFTNTPDEHFILDTLPGQPNVAIAAGFSGHGFKFASVVGEIIADLVTNGETSHNINMFGVSRFGV